MCTGKQSQSLYTLNTSWHFLPSSLWNRPTNLGLTPKALAGNDILMIAFKWCSLKVHGATLQQPPFPLSHRSQCCKKNNKKKLSLPPKNSAGTNNGAGCRAVGFIRTITHTITNTHRQLDHQHMGPSTDRIYPLFFLAQAAERARPLELFSICARLLTVTHHAARGWCWCGCCQADVRPFSGNSILFSAHITY